MLVELSSPRPTRWMVPTTSKLIPLSSIGCTHRRPAGEEVLGHLIAQHNHVAALALIQPVEPASLFQGQIADPIVLRLHAGDFAVGAGELAHCPHIAARKHRSHCQDMRRFAADVKVILVRKR